MYSKLPYLILFYEIEDVGIHACIHACIHALVGTVMNLRVPEMRGIS